MGKFSDELKAKAQTLTKDDVLKGLDFIARTFLPLPYYTYAAVYKAIDIVKAIDEKTMTCRSEEQSGKATMYHKDFVDELKSQLAAKDTEIEVLRGQRDRYRYEATEAETLKKKLGELLK